MGEDAGGLWHVAFDDLNIYGLANLPDQPPHTERYFSGELILGTILAPRSERWTSPGAGRFVATARNSDW